MASHRELPPRPGEGSGAFRLPQQRPPGLVERGSARYIRDTKWVVRQGGGAFDTALKKAAEWQRFADSGRVLKDINPYCEVDPSDAFDPAAAVLAGAIEKAEQLTYEALKLLKQTGRARHAVDRLPPTEAEIADAHAFVEKVTSKIPKIKPDSVIAEETEKKIDISVTYHVKDLMGDIHQIYQQVAVDGLAAVLERVVSMPPHELPASGDADGVE